MLRKIKLISLWFKEFFRRCPLRKNFTKEDPPFWIIGHRGSPAVEVENTIPSFERALREGANGIEIDLCLTKDKKVIIWHDWNPNEVIPILRESGFEPFIKYKPHPPGLTSEFRKKVSDLTLEEFRTHFRYKQRHKHEVFPVDVHIPTLDEFFAWSKKHPEMKCLFLDIKVPDDQSELVLEMLELTNAYIKEYDITYLILVETSSKLIYDTMKKHYPDFKYALDIELSPGFIFETEEYSAVKAAYANGNACALSLRPRKVTFANWTTYRRIVRYDVAFLRKIRKIKEDCKIEWLIGATVSKDKELKCLVRLGIEGIQTDFPARLKKICDKYGRHLA